MTAATKEPPFIDSPEIAWLQRAPVGFHHRGTSPPDTADRTVPPQRHPPPGTRIAPRRTNCGLDWDCVAATAQTPSERRRVFRRPSAAHPRALWRERVEPPQHRSRWPLPPGPVEPPHHDCRVRAATTRDTKSARF